MRYALAIVAGIVAGYYLRGHYCACAGEAPSTPGVDPDVDRAELGDVVDQLAATLRRPFSHAFMMADDDERGCGC